MKNVMIDIETLSRNVGGVVMSIAAVEFDKTPSLSDLVYEDGSASAEKLIKNTLYMNLDIKEQILAGAEIEPETVEWWRGQKEAQRFLFKPPHLGMVHALMNLRSFIEEDEEETQVWSQGTDFDIAFLRDLYSKHDAAGCPWKHDHIRDSRTFIFTIGGMFDKDPYSVIPKFKEGMPHDALFDAIRAAYNVTYLTAFFNENQKRNGEEE